MKNKSFSSAKMIIYNFLVPFMVLGLPILYTLFMIILNKANSIFICCIILLYIFIWCMFFFSLCHNAYEIIRIDHDGIHNRYISIKWCDITYIKLMDIELFKYTFPKPLIIGDIMVIGNAEIRDGFQNIDKKQCIIMSLTKKNKLLLNEYCKNDAVLSMI